MEYTNIFFSPNSFSQNATFSTSEKPLEYKGFLIVHYSTSQFHIVKNGFCVGMHAGIDGAKRRIDNDLEELTRRSITGMPQKVKAQTIQLIATQQNYNFWIGIDEHERPFFNVTPVNQEQPKGGYYSPEYICSLKHVPNLFKTL